VSQGIQFPETRAKAAEQAAAAERSTAAVGLNMLVPAADDRIQRKHTSVDGA
jgi:hypothetical protein